MISSVPISRVVKSNFPCDSSADHQLSSPLAFAPLRWSPWDDYGYFHQTTCLKTVMEILINTGCIYIAVNYCNWVYITVNCCNWVYCTQVCCWFNTILSTKLSHHTGCFHRHSTPECHEIESRVLYICCWAGLARESEIESRYFHCTLLYTDRHYTYMLESLASGWSHWKTRSYRAEMSCSRDRVMTYVRSYLNKNTSLSRMPYFIWVADSSRGSCRL